MRPPPPPPEGTANTPFVGTPPHRTDKPWTEVVKKCATTPLTAARASPKPNHPFETTNQFTTLRFTHDDSTDDGSDQSDDILLTPADGDATVTLDGARNIAADGTIAAQTDGADPIDNAATLDTTGDIAAQPDGAAAPRSTLSMLEAMIMANAAGITALGELMRENVTSIKALTRTVNNTSSQLTTLITDFKEVKETAENAYRLASKANPSITSQGVHLLDLVNDVSRLNSDIDELKASMATPPELNTLVQSAIEPVKVSRDKTLALAIETAETAIKASFDTSVTTLNDKVAESIKAFEKKIDALHGSYYGHLTKTTLPEFARLIKALEACARPSTTIPTDKVDPSDNEDVGANNQRRSADDASTRRRSDAATDVDDGLDANTRSQNAWAETRARNGLDPAPTGSTTPGPPQK
jgi:hypothetical protein